MHESTSNNTDPAPKPTLLSDLQASIEKLREFPETDDYMWMRKASFDKLCQEIGLVDPPQLKEGQSVTFNSLAMMRVCIDETVAEGTVETGTYSRQSHRPWPMKIVRHRYQI
jgi:hypothetical protein